MTEKELEQIKSIARKAGEKVLEIYETNFHKERKKDNSFVTKADLASEEIILEGLKDFGYPILSEEKTDDLKRLDSDTLFIVDPLDGTRDFIEGTGDFSIMIGLAKEGTPEMGVVYKPVGDKLYYGQKGEGSFLKEKDKREKRLNVSSEEELEKSNLVMSRFHLSNTEETLLNQKIVKGSIRKGSIGVKVGLIAEGKAEGYFNHSARTCEWDTCAPELILREADGKLTDLAGDNLDYNSESVNNENGVVATNGNIHHSLIKKLKEAYKD